MRINFLNVNYNYNFPKAERKPSYGFLSPLKQDCVSFGNLKKSAFQGIDLAVVNKFKAPIEKFNSNEEMQAWCKKEAYEKYTSKYYTAQHEEATYRRQKRLDEWFDYLGGSESNLKESEKLFILSGLTQNLKTSNDDMPLLLNEEVLKETMESINSRFEADKNLMLNFRTEYGEKLKEHYIKKSSLNGEKTGWMAIPSYNDDFLNFEENVQKLQLFSAKTWCTKTYKAPAYVIGGGMDIFLEDGKPKVGIKYSRGTVTEIQGENNDSVICDKKLLSEIDERIKGRKVDFEAKLQFNALKDIYGNEDK